MPAFSPRYDAALAFAARAHRNQVRKGTDIPYIAHVAHVSIMLIRYGFSENIAVAALLHDVVEDCDVPLEAVQREFGDEVARLVDAVSERKFIDGVKLSWEERKNDKLAHLRAGGAEVAALKAADAIHNAQSIVIDLQDCGTSVWTRFKGTPEQTLWYYREILASVQAWLGEHPIVGELAGVVGELEKAIHST